MREAGIARGGSHGGGGGLAGTSRATSRSRRGGRFLAAAAGRGEFRHGYHRGKIILCKRKQNASVKSSISRLNLKRDSLFSQLVFQIFSAENCLEKVVEKVEVEDAKRFNALGIRFSDGKRKFSFSSLLYLEPLSATLVSVYFFFFAGNKLSVVLAETFRKRASRRRLWEE